MPEGSEIGRTSFVWTARDFRRASYERVLFGSKRLTFLALSIIPPVIFYVLAAPLLLIGFYFVLPGLMFTLAIETIIFRVTRQLNGKAMTYIFFEHQCTILDPLGTESTFKYENIQLVGLVKTAIELKYVSTPFLLFRAPLRAAGLEQIVIEKLSAKTTVRG